MEVDLEGEAFRIVAAYANRWTLENDTAGMLVSDQGIVRACINAYGWTHEDGTAGMPVNAQGRVCARACVHARVRVCKSVVLKWWTLEDGTAGMLVSAWRAVRAHMHVYARACACMQIRGRLRTAYLACL